jgi:hypothetical protein
MPSGKSMGSAHSDEEECVLGHLVLSGQPFPPSAVPHLQTGHWVMLQVESTAELLWPWQWKGMGPGVRGWA